MNVICKEEQKHMIWTGRMLNYQLKTYRNGSDDNLHINRNSTWYLKQKNNSYQTKLVLKSKQVHLRKY